METKMEEKNTAKDNQQEESRQESEKQAASADISPKPKRKKKSPTEKKLKPHLLDETIKLNDLYYSFHQEKLEQILQKLNEVLGNAAITITADEYTELKIHIDLDKYQSITTRRAGRRKKKTNVLYEQIVEYSKTHTAMETAEWLGLTRQTYYRKLKQHRENGDDGKTEF